MVDQLGLFTLPSRAVFREEKSRFSAVLESNLIDFGFYHLGRSRRSGGDTTQELSDHQDAARHHAARASIPVYKDQEFPQSGNFLLNGMRYHSRSEAACAVLMELFIPGFRAVIGKTFQISIGSDGNGNELSVDFLVNGVLVEYHPPHLKSRSFKNEKGLKNYIQKQKKRYQKLGKAPGKGAYKRVTEWYYKKRRSQIDKCGAHKGRKLIVASNPEEFYHRVIRRWGKGPFPDRAEFLELFEKVQGKVAVVKTSPKYKGKKRRSGNGKYPYPKRRSSKRSHKRRRKKAA